MTTTMVADRLKLHVKTVLRLIHDGKLQAGMKDGKAYDISEEQFAQFMDDSTYIPQHDCTKREALERGLTV